MRSGDPHGGHANRRFCCKKCARDYSNGKRSAAVVEAKRALKRTCKECSAPIPPEKNDTARFCRTNGCAGYHQRRKRTEAVLPMKIGRTCEWCAGTIAPAKKLGTRFCCERCEKAAWHHRKRAKG